jgi:hypothetical protein
MSPDHHGISDDVAIDCGQFCDDHYCCVNRAVDMAVDLNLARCLKFSANNKISGNDGKHSWRSWRAVEVNLFRGGCAAGGSLSRSK